MPIVPITLMKNSLSAAFVLLLMPTSCESLKESSKYQFDFDILTILFKYRFAMDWHQSWP